MQMTNDKYPADIIETVAQFIWREFENDHDFDPSYAYANDARRYAVAALDALDRWLAQVRADAAAQALEEAADAAEITDCPCSYAATPGRFCVQHSHHHAHAHAGQLRARAATYRKEQTNAD